MVVCCNFSPQSSCTLIPLAGPAALPVMVLPVICTWSQVLWVGPGGVGPQFGQIRIAALCCEMFDITRLLMVVLEKVCPVTGGPCPNSPAEGLRRKTQPYKQFWSASPFRVLPPDMTKIVRFPDRLVSVISGFPS